jgi:hypothetical protein
MKNNKLTLKALKAELELMKANKLAGVGALVDIGSKALIVKCTI